MCVNIRCCRQAFVPELELREFEIARQLIDDRTSCMPERMKAAVARQSFDAGAVHGRIEHAFADLIRIARGAIGFRKKMIGWLGEYLMAAIRRSRRTIQRCLRLLERGLYLQPRDPRRSLTDVHRITDHARQAAPSETSRARLAFNAKKIRGVKRVTRLQIFRFQRTDKL
jgi:hypothetical protein